MRGCGLIAVPRSLRRATIVLLLTLLAVEGLAGQALRPGDPELDYLRTLQLLGRADPGSLTLLPTKPAGGVAGLARGTHPWSARYPSRAGVEDGSASFVPRGATLRTYVNTSYPVGQNDGAVWQGKGATTALDVRADARWRGLSVTLAPMLIHTQNASFELTPTVPAGMPPYAYPWRRIDMPQRFGPDPSWTLDPGDTEIRVRAFGASASFGTTSRWWGPGIRNAIVMSNNAPGFVHASLGTDGPRRVGIGDLEVDWIVGDLDQSEWFDPSVTSTDRYLTGIVAAFSPDFLSGLTLGMARVFYARTPEGGAGFAEYFPFFEGFRKEFTGEDERDQMLSLFGRWVLRDAGFEFYWEWARNDHSYNFRDLVLDLGHSGASILGVQKAIELADRILVLRAELADLERSTNALRAVPTYYAHHIVTQGYTNEGQLIGAGVGPGGSSQHLGFDLYDAWGRATLYVERAVRDNDAFYDWAVANNVTRWERDVLLHGGIGALLFVGDFDVGAGMVLTRELNRYFVGRDLWNLNASVALTWKPQ